MHRMLPDLYAFDMSRQNEPLDLLNFGSLLDLGYLTVEFRQGFHCVKGLVRCCLVGHA